jgi:two-component system chemotaxis response regulator CheB
MTLERPIRVLIVDDSAFARKVIREVLSNADDMEIVGIARDGLDALEQCSTAKPDVVTLDLMMPELDGLGVLRSLAEMEDAPRVVLVSSTTLDSRIAVEALQLGAVALVQKPTALASAQLYEVGTQLKQQIRIAASALRGRVPLSPAPTEIIAARERSGSPIEVVVVGTSTGGPQALTRLFTALPADFAVPVIAVVHIPVGFTSSLAERIDRSSPLQVLEASEGLQVRPGMAVIARAGVHLALERRAAKIAGCALSPEPIAHLHRPAVDVLFSSAAQAFGSRVLAVVLTGMGNDGLEGARAIQRVGGTVFTEHASSCVVDGMPSSVLKAGLSDAQFALPQMAAALLQRV